MTMEKTKYVGASIPRKEDRRLLSGEGMFVADVQLPRMLHVAFVRSSVAHARICAVDTSQARRAPGVVEVLTGADIRTWLTPIPGMQNRPPQRWREAVEHKITIPDQPIMAIDKVHYVGEPIAVVVAESRYLAEDAAELVTVDLEPIAPVTSIDEALSSDAPKIHENLESNIVAKFRVVKGDVEPILSSAPHRLCHQFYNHRYLALPIECRGVVAQYEQRLDSLTIWSSTQVVHWVRREVAARLNMQEARVRCIAPDVGGGFGVKGHVYPEDVLIAFLARHLGRAVKWVEDRQEHLLNSTHARDDRHDVEVAFDAEGRILALRDRFVKDSGAYTPVGIGAPSNTIAHLLGPYHVANYDATATVVVTNKTPNAPYRGSGRPEAVFVIERLMDLIAHEIGADPVSVRRKNMITAEQIPYSVGIPYRDGTPIVYDSGDYPAAMEKAIAALGGLEEIRAVQQSAWREGRFVGLGVANYVEGTGAGPFEGATVRVDPSGGIFVATGACAQGQGHETVFAQVAADEWGVTPDDVSVTVSDTASIAYGYGTIASRSAVNSSSAIRMASVELKKRVLAIAGHMLECGVEDLELAHGRVVVKGIPKLSVTLKEIAHAAKPGWDHGRPPGVAAGLEVTEYFEPPTVTWAYATHAAIVEVDVDTGKPRILRYVIAHDAGTLLNPKLAEGQIIGGACQGIGGGLLEEVVYDQDGQILTGSLMDYLAPTASEMPFIQVLHEETRSPLNELGVKGIGEGGALAPPVVLANAVCDALRPLRFEVFASPLRCPQIVKALKSPPESPVS